MARPPVKTTKQVVNRIKQAQARVESATGKKVLVRKPDAKPVTFTPLSKAAGFRRSKETLSLRDMMRETTARTRQLMREGNVQVISLRRTKSGRAILCETETQKPRGENTKYKQIITNLDAYTANFGDSKWIQVECTCKRFQFAHDWSLHQKQASNLKYSTDEPSLITNPLQLLGTCKHLYRVIQALVAKSM